MRRKERGFTLVELMVVIVLIGLLAGVVGVSVIPALLKGKKATALNQIKELEKAMELFYVDYSRYPDSLDELTGDHSEYGYPDGYISEVPLDPWGEEYIYEPEGGTGKAYLILSKGADRTEATEDDVSNESERKSGGT
ncbi:MAG: type II secretion system major pseudopilin GspG [Planctomycetota bacterium]|jgi:general secretion pathway protein G